MAILTWVFAIPLLGMMTGLRTMTPIALVCWFAYRGNLSLDHTWAFWAARLVTAIVFSVLALGEYVGDKLPTTPSRIAAFPLAARILFGGLVGGIAATGIKGSIPEGMLLGALGALLGSFLGYHARKHLVESTGRPDWNVAVVEDAATVLLSLFALGVITG